MYFGYGEYLNLVQNGHIKNGTSIRGHFQNAIGVQAFFVDAYNNLTNSTKVKKEKI